MLATTNFLAIDVGDGYAMLNGARLLISPEQGLSDFDILRRAIVAAKSIAPKVDRRIKRLDSARSPQADCVETK